MQQNDTLVFTTSPNTHPDCHLEEDVWTKLSDMCKSFVEHRSCKQKLLLCQAFAVESYYLRIGVATSARHTTCYRFAESCSDQISLEGLADPALRSSVIVLDHGKEMATSRVQSRSTE